VDTELVNKVFTFLKNKGGQSWLAGGAPRDFIMERQISDYDFFTTANLQPKDIEQLAKKIGVSKEHVCTLEGEGNEYAGEMSTVWQIGSSVQLVVEPSSLFSLESLFDRFDIGLCKAAIGTDGELITDPQFDRDREAQTLTVYINDANSKHMGRTFSYHLPKLQYKYPEFKVAVHGSNLHQTGNPATVGQRLTDMLKPLQIHAPRLNWTSIGSSAMEKQRQAEVAPWTQMMKGKRGSF
jgi:DNA-binding XRE family transcriptional regulator